MTTTGAINFYVVECSALKMTVLETTETTDADAKTAYDADITKAIDVEYTVTPGSATSGCTPWQDGIFAKFTAAGYAEPTDEATDAGDAGEEGAGEESAGEESAGEEGAGEEGSEEVPEEEAEEPAEPTKMPVTLLKSHSKLPDFTIEELVRKFADVSAACEDKNCVLEQDMNVRVDAFGHKTDEETGDTAFYALSQKFTKEDDKTKASIVFTDYTLTKDGTLTPGPEVVLVPEGSKPQIWKTGHLEFDPILVAYETPSRE